MGTIREDTKAAFGTARGDGAALYLDLMKRCLTDSLFADDPLAYFIPYEPKPDTAAWKRRAIGALCRVLSGYQVRLVEPYRDAFGCNFSKLSAAEQAAIREDGTHWPARAHTMIGMKRLNNLQHCAETAIREGIAGDFMETGVWRGGACIFMRAILSAYGDTQRAVWAADSFQGLPPPNAAEYSADTGDRHHSYSPWLSCSQEEVEENFRRYGLLDERVHFLRGWFKDTLPNAPIERLAILRLDGDMYESTIQVLNALYDKLSPGGFLIVDDYFLEPCAQAIHDFRGTRDIQDEIRDIDGMGAYWQKQ